MSLEHDAARLGFHDMTVKDWKDLQTACRKVFELMHDGCWHHASAIIKASGQREGLRRMRELRSIGFTVEIHRVTPDEREWLYKLVTSSELLEQANTKQQELF
jgi:hypothetical protein